MLSYIEGLVFDKSDNLVSVKLALGLVFDVFVIKDLAKNAHTGDSVQFFTFLHLTEGKIELYGFKSRAEKDFFELLISVGGVGPRSALHILELDDIEKIKLAILQENLDYLSQVSGIGKKTAKKIIVELQDKIEKLDSQLNLNEDKSVLDALVALGFSLSDAKKAVNSLDPSLKSESDKIKFAINYLSNNKL